MQWSVALDAPLDLEVDRESLWAAAGRKAEGALMGRREYSRDAAIWDDDAFRLRVAWIADSQNRAMSEVLKAAGLSRHYFHRAPSEGGRTITSIIRLARALDVPVCDLIEGWPGSR